ncbi:MAG: hypothetical protein VYA30_14340 [Myxococcota bacterium]|nr:hypothetical protein [Myxococcota bacterium]
MTNTTRHFAHRVELNGGIMLPFFFIIGTFLGTPLAPTEVRTQLETLANARIVWSTTSGQARVITRIKLPTQGKTNRERGRYFLDRFSLLTGGPGLRFESEVTTKGRTVLRYRQWHDNTIVLDRSATVTVDGDGHIIAFNTDCVPITGAARAVIDERQARAAVSSALEARFGSKPVGMKAIEAVFGLTTTGAFATPIYEFNVAPLPMVSHVKVRIDASTGALLSIRNALLH